MFALPRVQASAKTPFFAALRRVKDHRIPCARRGWVCAYFTCSRIPYLYTSDATTLLQTCADASAPSQSAPPLTSKHSTPPLVVDRSLFSSSRLLLPFVICLTAAGIQRSVTERLFATHPTHPGPVSTSLWIIMNHYSGANCFVGPSLHFLFRTPVRKKAPPGGPFVRQH